MRSDDMDTSQERDDKSNQISAEDIKSRANDEYKAGRYADAVKLYTQAIVASPQAATYYANRAAALTMLKKYKEAAEDCRQATILDPNNVKAFLRAGKCHLNLGNLLESSRQYQAALQLDQSNAVTLKEMHLFQNVSNYLQQMEMYMANMQWALALNSLDRAIKIVDADAVPLKWKISRGEILLGKREFDEAGRIATDVLRLDSQNPDALYFRARVFYIQGENSKTITHCTETLRCDPDHKDARILLRRVRALEAEKEAGNVAFKIGKFQEAYDIYTKALAIDQENEGTNSKLYSNRATVLTKLGRNDEAISDCDKALELDPNFSKVYVKRATAHMKLEHYEEAVRDYKAAHERDKGNREIRSQLHEAELALKKSLRKDYYKVLSISKDCSDADIKKAYRKLALQYHPDKNAGDEKAEVKFKEIGEAYAILSDPQKKQRYDSGVDLDGMNNGFPGGVDIDVNDIFAQFFGGGVGGMGGMGGTGSADFGGFGGFPGGGFSTGRTHNSFHHGRPQQGFPPGAQFHFG